MISSSIDEVCVQNCMISLTSSIVACLCGMKLHMQAVLSILLAAFSGFGVAMCGTSVLSEILRLRRVWLAQFNQQDGSQEVMQPRNEPSAATNQASQADSQHGGGETIELRM